VQRLKLTRQFCAAAFFTSGMEARRVKTRRSRGFSAADSPARRDAPVHLPISKVVRCHVVLVLGGQRPQLLKRVLEPKLLVLALPQFAPDRRDLKTAQQTFIGQPSSPIAVKARASEKM
jgi:hypothetical protein